MIGPLTDARRFEFPVEEAAAIVGELKSPVVARWYRVEKRTVPISSRFTVDLGFGRTDLDAGTPELAERTVEIEAPAAVFKGQGAILSIDVDPIDLSAWLAGDPDLLTPAPFEVGFDQWRAMAPRRD